MVDIKKLRDVIQDSGVKKKHIAETIGVSEQTLRSRLYGDSVFKEREIYALADLLRLTPDDITNIFFACDVT